MRSSRTNTVLSLLALALVGCDKGGLYPLLEKRDPAASASCIAAGQSSTWLRSTAIGTEILLVATPDPTATTQGNAQICFAHALVEHDSSTRYEYGGYTVAANGTGTLSVATTYVFDYVATGPILDRKGSKREVHAPPLDVPLTLRASGAGLEVTMNGVTGRYTNLYDVVASVDITTQEGAEDLFRLVNLPLFTSQVRLLGFGGGGMTQYISAPGRFVGLARPEAELANHFTVRVQSFTSPNTDIEFVMFEDLSGIVVEGLQETDVSISGNGSMHGVLSFSMRDGPDPVSDVALRGTIDYADMKIGNGVASGGTYELALTSPSEVTFTVPYTLASDVDLRRLLPEDGP